MSNKGDIVTTDLGLADKLVLDEFVRTIVGQMFENDNDTASLEVVLNGTDIPEPPTIEFEIRLTKINGVSTRRDEDAKK